MELKIDKSAWVSVTLGEVAFEVSDRIDAPAESEYDRFVGLEHFVSGEVKIQQWESTRSLVSAAKAFRKGDVLFARRNAYLRRASMVDFDGCCSGDAYVLRENNEVIVPGLLPFIVNSKSLWDFANSNAAGTMSKRVKWKDLANYEFLLPPKDQQSEIAELLWALDSKKESQSSLAKSADTLLQVKSSNLIWGSQFQFEALRSYTDGAKLSFTDGDWIESKDQAEDGIRLLQLADIGIGTFLDKSSKFISDETFVRLKCHEIHEGDILIARMPEPIGRACVMPKLQKRAITAVDVCVMKVAESHDTSFVEFLLNSREFLQKANSLASGTTRQRVSRSNLEKIKVPKPHYQAQVEIERELSLLKSTSAEIYEGLALLIQLQSAVIGEIFSDV